jgi:hypothetical protein
MTLQAYVLIQVEPGQAGRVASAIRDLAQIVSCDVLAGPYSSRWPGVRRRGSKQAGG